MPSPETRRCAVISTSHVTGATARFLDATPVKDWPCVGGPYGEYGWFLYAHDENNCAGADAIPDDLFAVMAWARGQGCDNVLLDCDGETVDGLALHEW